MSILVQSEEYKQYIQSPEWKQKREKRMKIDDFTCVMCGRSADEVRGGLQIHHVNYMNLGHEDPLTDLVCLCGSCHRKLHNFYNRRRK